MSRHRFIRNLDLDAAMEDEEQEEGMTREEQARMATSLPIARALLKDIKPPISDDAIADSLWHYWFDVEKAVAWLRKDWEKKGSSIPSELLPTPTTSGSDSKRRLKRQRLDNEPNATNNPASPTPPLSALQRLSLSRKAAAVSTSDPLGTPLAVIPPLPVAESSTGSKESPKPLSKLALLAQKRREAALASAVPSEAHPKESSTAPSSSPSISIGAVDVSSVEKPLSKLAQKMAAARAAKAASPAPNTSHAEQPPQADVDMEAPTTSLEDAMSELFVSHSSESRSSPSAFFKLLTSANPSLSLQSGEVVEPLGNLHLPFVADQENLEKRVRAAFGPDSESPDDIVLKARSGRAGTSKLSTAINGNP